MLNFLCVRFPLKLDPYTDGDERCRCFLSQAIAAKDYRTIFSLVYGNLVDMNWVPELAVTLAKMVTHDIRSMFTFINCMCLYLHEKLKSMSEAEDRSRLQFLDYLLEQIVHSCPEENLVEMDMDMNVVDCWALMKSDPSAEVEGWNYYCEWFGDHVDPGGPWDEFDDFIRMDVDHYYPHGMGRGIEVSEAEQDSDHGSDDEASASERSP